MITKLIILILMAVFYLAYFIKMAMQRKQGIRTDQLGKGKVGFARAIEIVLKLSTCLLPLLQLTATDVALSSAGIVFTLIGVIVFILSITEMKDNWRAGVQKEKKTSLVTSGIYSVSRNPAFLGFDLMYIGILLAFFNVYLCIATVFVMVLFHLQIVKVEEPFLREAFGDEYIRYTQEVHRYIGRPADRSICIPLAVVCGLIAWLLSFTASCFRNVEIILITVAGCAIGACIGAVISSILNCERRERNERK